ncbi:hypothetical protein ALNOE001_20710 [Candidatus Methanobinarius endosymbioticus]|uniref:Uncharacterized protein n=1 Tax=Candidatus Methanobinarius endosymbioticus TaxID=2006182 RepID=A0A366M926_9EURY|nr:hypothetical protein ALNOE001_20710 [Candidatus Methanobinarius endosymbioticus]
MWLLLSSALGFGLSSGLGSGFGSSLGSGFLLIIVPVNCCTSLAVINV